MKGSTRRPEQVAETLRQVVTDALAAGGARSAGRVRDGDERAGDQRSLARDASWSSVPGDDADQGSGARGAPERRRLPPLAGGQDPDHPHRARAPLRAGPGARARGQDQRAAERDPPRGARLIGAVLVDKPAGLTSHDVVHRVTAGAGDPGGGAHRDARSVRHRPAGDAGGQGHAARAVRRGAAQDVPRHRPPRRRGRTPTIAPAPPLGPIRSGLGHSARRRSGRRWRDSRGCSGSGRRASPPSTWRECGATGWPGGVGPWSFPR